MCADDLAVSHFLIIDETVVTLRCKKLFTLLSVKNEPMIILYTVVEENEMYKYNDYSGGYPEIGGGGGCGGAAMVARVVAKEVVATMVAARIVAARVVAARAAKAVSSEQRAASSEQRAASSEQRAVSSEQ